MRRMCFSKLLGLYAVSCASVCLSSAAPGIPEKGRTYQDLHIPQAITGSNFQINLHKSSKSFWKGATTKTYGYNKESFWGPTLIFNQGDTVKVDVKNDLDEPMTNHWHGLHIPAAVDGGPHQIIAPGTTWSPSFKVQNHAGTYWYHPHVHEKTQKQITYGAGGLIIIRDPEESALKLPRTYGVDDIPLVLTSRRFYPNNEFSFEGDNDKYGDYLLANGTLDAKVSLPAQFVRFRILNAEVERGYNLGFRDSRPFLVIATDGGLVEKPIPLQRMMLMPGERVEILVNLGKDKVGTSLDLMAFNAGHPFGFPGGEPTDDRPNGSYLNNIDFQILRIQVKSATPNAVADIPSTLVKTSFLNESDVTNKRILNITGGRPDFSFDNRPYKMHLVNQVVKLGATEKWTIQNNNIFGHSFHIHDVQFQIVSRSSGKVAEYERGWKDTVYIPRSESVSFIAKFDDFESDMDSYMYHCHMSNHEDGGLMGEFIVSKNPNSPTAIAFREGREHPVTEEMARAANSTAGKLAPVFHLISSGPNGTVASSLATTKPVVLFFIELQCPCSKDATVFINELASKYSDVCQVVGVINSNEALARQWCAEAGCKFPVIPDPSLKLITAYGAKSSVHTTLIEPGGKIAKTYPGYSKAMLLELETRVAALGKTKLRGSDFSKASNKLLSGCPFGFSVASKEH